MFKRYECIRQHDAKDCACACLAAICRQYGLKMPMSAIREKAGTDKMGTSTYGIVKAAQELGFEAKGVKIDSTQDIFKPFPLPAIAHVIVDNTLLHYVVIHKITEEKIIIADPAKGIINYKPDDFFNIWTGVLIVMVPTDEFEKGDKTQGLFRRYFGLIKVQKGLVAGIFFTSVFAVILGIIGAFYFKYLLDDIVPNRLEHSLIIISIAVIILNLFKMLTEFLRSQLLICLSQRIDIPLLLGYYNHVINLPMNFFAARQIGEIISRFNDAGKIREAISSATLTIMIDTLMAAIGGAILYNQNKLLFLLAIIPIALYALIIFTFKKPIQAVNRRVMEDNSKLTSYLVESIAGIETVKSFNYENDVKLETEKRLIKLIKSIFRYGLTTNLQASIKAAVKSVFGIIILWTGTYLTIKGQISMGQLISFNALLVYFLEPIERLINLQPSIQSAMVAAERLGDVMDLELEKTDDAIKQVPQSLAGDLELKNIDFRYGTRQLVLKNINMTINTGHKVALVGESGSGKTTIAKLIMNFYQCEKGEILINGYNINDISKEALRDKIAYISQDTFFFSGTIKENLQMAAKKAKKDISHEEIIEACKNAHIHDFIASMPLMYDTVLEENASNLSGGQKQRLAIARAMLLEPHILIMDEATSNLDSITEKAIERTITNFTGDVTTIIIAHRLSTVKRCDKIFVLEGGRIIEEGGHKELLNRRGYYYRLWKEQLSEDENI